MEDNNKKEKKVLKLKLKTFADFKRFTSKQLHKIVEKLREKDKDTSLQQLESEGKYFEIMKYAARQSLVKRADRSREKQEQKIMDAYIAKNEKLMEAKENGVISEEQYARAVEQLKYKMEKKEYVKDLGPEDQEKPKNPAIQRAIKNVGKVVKTVGKGVAVVVAAPFVLGYKVATGIGRGVKAIGRRGKVAALTAGKVAGNVKDQVQTARGEVHREMYEKASEDKKQEMMEQAYRQADKEDAKREREAARREKLHMKAEQQQIDHEEAMKKTGENANEQEREEEK
ncbi:MAG: hypothetical protein HFJ42_03230 [Clostridia bacterium]|nr:hypothetical protein [Clostridia bacterium]